MAKRKIGKGIEEALAAHCVLPCYTALSSLSDELLSGNGNWKQLFPLYVILVRALLQDMKAI